MSIKIVIVDDKPQNRLLLQEQFAFSPAFEIVFIAKNGVDFLDKMKELRVEQYPQVVLMDIEMPEMDGIETVSKSHILYPHIKFLMLTVFDDEDKIFEAIRAGAQGYLLKNEKISVIEEYIQQVEEVGGVPMSPSIARKAMHMLVNSNAREPKAQQVSASGESELSDREFEVLNLLVSGYDYKVIAEKLFLSSHTVRKHIANIYTKLHVSSKAQAINLAHKKRWFGVS
ncbi:MAG: response regulator transcription factor [Bacteroidia bacterium]|nr:response regulator transcription factor [Bacteroidia bacterium]